MEIWPSARTLRIPGSDVGVVVCHGFTGSVASVEPWARAIAEGTGATVISPRLQGHGTRWQDMHKVSWQDWVDDVERAHSEVASQCSTVFIAGLSMGGSLALGLAAHHDAAGVLLVNPAVTSRDPRFKVVGALKHVVRSQPGIASDIAKPGSEEPAYARVSVPAVHQMTKLWRVVRSDLGRVTAPVLLFRSDVDNIVDDASHLHIMAELPQTRLVPLRRSRHVATLDHDAELIFEESVRFINQHVRPDGAVDE